MEFSAKLLRKVTQFPPSLAVFAIALLVYGLTAVPDLTFAFHSGDGGELITAVFTGGIPHPPGYPTYLLLGKLAARLPIDPIAYRFSLFSAFCGAVAAAITSAASRSLGLSGWRTMVPGFMLAFGLLVWQQAVVTEVYMLNLALVAFFMWGLLGKRPSWLVGLLLGLCLTTHLTSVLLLPLALLLVPKKDWLQLGAGFVLGLTPFLLLPTLAQPDSPVVWGQPKSIVGWGWLVSAQLYQPNQLALPASKMLPRFMVWSQVWLRQLLWLGWPLLLWSGWQEKDRKQWLALAGTAAAYLGYAFFYDTPDAFVLTLPAWLLLSLALATAFNQLKHWAFVLPFSLILLNFNLINSADIHKIRPFAEQILNSSPTNAILITSGDPDIFALWYFHFVEGQRPDLVIVDDQLFAFDWYRSRLQTLYPRLQGLSKDDVPAFRTINASQQPICTVSLGEAGELTVRNSCVEEPEYDNQGQ